MGTAPRPLPGPAPESPLAQLSDEALIRRYCAALANGTTDEEAAGELWHGRHKPILLQKIKYIAAKPGHVRPDVIDFGPFVEASLGWAWQKPGFQTGTPHLAGTGRLHVLYNGAAENIDSRPATGTARRSCRPRGCTY